MHLGAWAISIAQAFFSSVLFQKGYPEERLDSLFLPSYSLDGKHACSLSGSETLLSRVFNI